MSLLVLLMIWVALEIVGWSFVWYGMRDSFNAIHTHLDALYFSGVNFFTVGFGDIVAVHGGARVLVMFAAFTGVTTMALVVGYLPTLYGAYSERERQLLLLDDLSGTETTAVGLIEAYRSGQDLSRLAALFDEWERWAAGVMETHTSYRMLMLFRSRRTGQSWLTALAVLAETSATVLACLPDAPLRAAMRYYRRSTELLGGLTRSSHVQVKQSLARAIRARRLPTRATTTSPGSGSSCARSTRRGPRCRRCATATCGPLAALFHLLLPPGGSSTPRCATPTCSSRLRRQTRAR